MFMHSPPPPPPRPAPITIFVHGTQFHTLVKDADLRQFFPPDTQTPAGLCVGAQLSDNHKIKKILTALSDADRDGFPFEGIYTFGWSGENLVHIREQAGNELFNLIKALAQEYKALHATGPDITIITHSHGGNVLLHGMQQSTEPIVISRAILLACPVQEITKQLVQSPLLKKIYSFHSHTELPQIADPQFIQPIRELTEKKAGGLQAVVKAFKQIQNMPLLSEQHFPAQPNLIQAEICWKTPPDSALFDDKGITAEQTLYKLKTTFNPLLLLQPRGLFHTEFTTDLFMAQLPFLIQQADSLPSVSKDLTFFIDGAWKNSLH